MFNWMSEPGVEWNNKAEKKYRIEIFDTNATIRRKWTFRIIVSIFDISRSGKNDNRQNDIAFHMILCCFVDFTWSESSHAKTKFQAIRTDSHHITAHCLTHFCEGQVTTTKCVFLLLSNCVRRVVNCFLLVVEAMLFCDTLCDNVSSVMLNRIFVVFSV